ncbi:hypothetical protein FHU10_4584 [Serratia fonticola]|uniref:DUF3108 domain-containing protein n=1 Tax=Serratia fonticola TaxID=47917 RepID=A0A542D310_SERFO|nr:hypothetical protein [Serratia fonticola]TQI80545.1 hypothetical protein FHU09_3121 [Serratia fonticola]TQI97430.1 hypothetical protein FHU11_2924 [Serratia fonticola]TVZ71927.1 hypothetical protein FHU10_4584 [Serratia fonticola]
MRIRYLTLTPMLLALIAMPLQAAPVKDYHAVYHILPLQGETPIGEYRVAQRWDAKHERYVQRASIAFSWKVLFSTHRYQYQDEVQYGADNSLSYTLQENNDGKSRMVSGELPAKGTALALNISDQQGNSRKTIDKAQFDLTLFALRFPAPCTAERIGTQRRARLLIPISGEVALGLSRYVGITDLRLPGVAEPLKDLCLIESTGNNKEMNRHSWVNRDGYLVYEISANYRLLLVPEASNLPSNHQEKP